MSEALRQRLLAVTAHSAETWPTRIDCLVPSFTHTITFVEGPIDRRSNCFAYALGLHEDPWFRSAAEAAESHCLADYRFINFLRDTGILRVAEGGELAIYFENGRAVHAGVRANGRIRSKWGTGGVFEHAEFELPSDCGSVISYFLLPRKETVVEAFRRFHSAK
jgi:hypothetical protein